MKYPELWNRFIDEVYDPYFAKENKPFSNEQKYASIALAYDGAVNNGGHICFFDGFGDVFSIDEVAEALRVTVGIEFSMNFLSAAAHIHYTDDYGYMPDEESDSDPIEDNIFYEMTPALPDLLEIYIFNNKEKIFQ